MPRMESHAFASFRVAISGQDDLHKLNRIIHAAFQKTINDRIVLKQEAVNQESAMQPKGS